MSHLKVLVANPDPGIIRLLRRHFERRGGATVVANFAQETLTLISVVWRTLLSARRKCRTCSSRSPKGLLVVLAVGRGQVLTYDEILTTVWRSGSGGAIQHLRRMVSSLRQKIEPDPVRTLYLNSASGRPRTLVC